MIRFRTRMEIGLYIMLLSEMNLRWYGCYTVEVLIWMLVTNDAKLLYILVSIKVILVLSKFSLTWDVIQVCRFVAVRILLSFCYFKFWILQMVTLLKVFDVCTRIVHLYGTLCNVTGFWRRYTSSWCYQQKTWWHVNIAFGTCSWYEYH